MEGEHTINPRNDERDRICKKKARQKTKFDLETLQTEDLADLSDDASDFEDELKKSMPKHGIFSSEDEDHYNSNENILEKR